MLEARDLMVSRPAAGLRLEVPHLRCVRGGVTAILGPSGSGKTTLLLGLLGLLHGDEVLLTGAARFQGRTVPAAGSAAWREWLRRDVGLLLQDARGALDPLQRVGAQVAAATGAAAAARDAAFAELVLDRELAHRFPHQLSGGQAQRVLLAVVLLRRPALVVADEPSASLDGERAEQVAARLCWLAERTGTAVLLATHDLALARAMRAEPRAIVDGRLQEGWPEPLAWPTVARPSPSEAGTPTSEAGTLTIVRASGIVVRFDRQPVLDGVDLALDRGTCTALVGPSGSGKTTLARVLAGHLRPDRGTVARPPSRTAVQMLFQDAHGSLTPHRRIDSLLAETSGRNASARRWTASTVAPPAVVELAQRLGLPPQLLRRTREELSGGERRRVALLRALSVQPQALILDEPTASLDRAAGKAVVEQVLRWREECSGTCLWITHDQELARAVGDRVLRLEGGRLCA